MTSRDPGRDRNPIDRRLLCIRMNLSGQRQLTRPAGVGHSAVATGRLTRRACSAEPTTSTAGRVYVREWLFADRS